MPRALRIEYPGAIYHVMNRGDHGEVIWKDAQDRALFLKLLSHTCLQAGWVLHSYVLMKNHYHLLIETQRATLVRGMQRLNSGYTQHYNRRWKLHGHLFQGRYKAVLVDAQSSGYFLKVSDYIHLNPARAGLCETTQEWLTMEWSSAAELLKTKRPEWLRWERVAAELSIERWDATGREKFRKHLVRCWGKKEDPEQKQEWKKMRRGWVWGGEDFIEEMKLRAGKLVNDKEIERWSGDAVTVTEEALAERMLAEAAQLAGVPTAASLGLKAKMQIAASIRSQTRVTLSWLSEKLGYRSSGGLASSLYIWKKSHTKRTDPFRGAV